MYRKHKHEALLYLTGNSLISYTPRHSKAKLCFVQKRFLNVHDASMPTTLDLFQRQRSETLEMSRWILSWRIYHPTWLGLDCCLGTSYNHMRFYLKHKKFEAEKRARCHAQSPKTKWYTYLYESSSGLSFGDSKHETLWTKISSACPWS